MSISRSDLRDPGATAGAGVASARLIDIPLPTFADEHWGSRALLTRGADDYSDLFSAGAVDQLLSERGLRTPFLRMAKDGSTLPERSFTAGAGVGATITDQLDDTAIWRQFADGATIVLQALHRTWAPITDFTARLGTELGHPVQANAYVTPPQNRGFDDHYDVHDVFVLQIEGSKRWIIHEPVHPDPLRDQPWTDRREAVADAAAGEPVIDTVLGPGDCLYLPRGWLHAAQAQGAVSIHLTLGIHNWTRYAVAEQLAQDALARLRQEPDLRASLPLGVDGTDEVVDQVRKALTAAVEQADPEPAFRRTRRTQARPAALGPLAQLAALDALTPQTALRLRGNLAPRLDGTRLHTRVGWLDLPADDVAAAELLLAGGVLVADELGLDFARRVLRAGIAIPARP
ncbi:cupin [Flexivirga sp. ID2601S]|uniref:Cupin n=1 Tax=Flexivirga aerilata TaxID=1656889 RepID=A0A849AG29_9MICO|nr:cupin domain-containing protein [Flexivirga aerilata]NNG39425.1 cupin [Flexivirga aerilata]